MPSRSPIARRPGRPLRSPRRGFSLIELMVVLTIVLLLVGISTPDLEGAEDRVRNVAMSADVHAVADALADYEGDHNGNDPPNLVDPGFLEGGYLAGNHLPVSPWCSQPQVSPAYLYANMGFAPTDWDYVKAAAGDTTIVAGWTHVLTYSDPPALPTDLGVLRYNAYPDEGTYQMFAQGRYNGQRVLLAPVTNDGD